MVSGGLDKPFVMNEFYADEGRALTQYSMSERNGPYHCSITVETLHRFTVGGVELTPFRCVSRGEDRCIPHALQETASSDIIPHALHLKSRTGRACKQEVKGQALQKEQKTRLIRQQKTYDCDKFV